MNYLIKNISYTISRLAAALYELQKGSVAKMVSNIKQP